MIWRIPRQGRLYFYCTQTKRVWCNSDVLRGEGGEYTSLPAETMTDARTVVERQGYVFDVMFDYTRWTRVPDNLEEGPFEGGFYKGVGCAIQRETRPLDRANLDAFAG